MPAVVQSRARSSFAAPSGGVWPDVSAFALGLSLAWWLDWRAADLVWSLWLSSLVVGYSMILWTIFNPLLDLWRKRGDAAEAWRSGPARFFSGLLLVGGGGLFMLGFFTVHFGGFHFVHSVFLNGFFPVWGDGGNRMPDLSMYAEVLRRYWYFLPAAFVAERAAFAARRRRPGAPADTAVTAEAIRRRKEAQTLGGGDSLFAPYKNVVRMHLLIFFFAGAHALRLDHFALYAVVYALYFFPWRILLKKKPGGHEGVPA